MINFLPIAILAYVLSGITAVIDKILLKKSIPNPLAYVFYISAMSMVAVLFLIPFGVNFNLNSTLFAALSGILGNFAFLTYFQALKKGEASIVAPIVGGANPLFTLILGSIFLGQILSPLQLLAFFMLMLGAVILTHNLWASKLTLNHQLLLMILSGFLFALTYLMLREAFLSSNFITGLVVSRITAGFSVLPLLLYPAARMQIFSGRATKNDFMNKTSALMLLGQSFGAGSGFLIALAVSFTTPALVNSMFGFQYLVILLAALFLAHERRSRLLDETLTKSALIQKVIGAGFLSLGVYLLSR